MTDDKFPEQTQSGQGFFQHSWGVLFGVRKLACAFPEAEQPHTNKGGSKLPHSKAHSGPNFWLRLGCSVFICVHLWFRSFFWLRLRCAREFVASNRKTATNSTN